MLGVEDERGVDLRERGRLVRLEDVAVERALEQVVVDAEQDVALWVAGGEQRSRDDLAGVAGLEDLQLEPALCLERLLHVLRDRERVVRDQHDLGRRLVAASAAGDGEQRGDQERRQQLRGAAVSRGTSRSDGEQHAVVDRDARLLGLEDVRDSASRAGLERLSAERVREALGRHAHRRPVDCEQRDEVARLPANRAPRRERRGRAPRRCSRRSPPMA